MMLVQQFLMTHSLAELESLHGVKYRMASRGHKVSLNYDQLAAKDEDRIAQECRGLILAPPAGYVQLDKPLGKTKVLARPFLRFFNHGQPSAAKVDLDHPDTRFYEKLDGTMTIVYWDSVMGEWHVATRAVPEADLPIDGFDNLTFRTLFEKALEHTTGLSFKDWTRNRDSRGTYLFELTTPANRIVVDYPDYKVTLLGARNTKTGAEFDPTELAPRMGVPHAPVYRFGNLQEMVDFVSSRNPQEHEGIVVCDPNFNRVKIKNPAYLALGRIRDTVMNSPRGLLELILLGKLDDALSLFPEHIRVRGLQIQDGLREMNHEFMGAYRTCKAVADLQEPISDPEDAVQVRAHRKAFALAVGAHKAWMPPMIDVYQGKVAGLHEWFLSKRQMDSGWSNSFLDGILNRMKA